MERVKGPDFPTHGLIVGREGIEDAYRTGRGSVRMRAVVTVEEDSRGRVQLVCTELPFQVNPDNLAEAIADAVKEGGACRGSARSPTSPATAWAAGWSSRCAATPSPRSC